MAMIRCPECGKEISDRALTCPNCGVPISLQMPIPVCFCRLKKSTASLRTLSLYVDGGLVGYLKNGESLTVDLLPGLHQVDLLIASVRASGTITIPDGANEARVELIMALRGPTVGQVIAK